MTNQKPKELLTPIEKGHFLKTPRLAVEYYGEDYLEKILKVTGSSVLHDYMHRQGINRV